MISRLSKQEGKRNKHAYNAGRWTDLHEVHETKKKAIQNIIIIIIIKKWQY